MCLRTVTAMMLQLQFQTKCQVTGAHVFFTVYCNDVTTHVQCTAMMLQLLFQTKCKQNARMSSYNRKAEATPFSETYARLGCF